MQITAKRRKLMNKLLVSIAAVILLITATYGNICFAQTGYFYELDFVYATSDAPWWTGLAVLNGEIFMTNNIRVECYDAAGTLTGFGVFTLTNRKAMRVGTLESIVTNGYVPERGSIVVLGEQYFEATEVIGNSSGGFGMVQQKAERF